MKLQDRLPDSVTVDGRRYRLRLDFRNVLRMNAVMADSGLIPKAREILALRCVMRRAPKNTGPVLAAVRELLFGEPEAAAHHEKIMDVDQDADLIRAAFRQNYGIDLWRDKLHWLEFSALLAGLPEGSRYSDIVGIRARPMPKPTKYNADERKWLGEAKARYAIKKTEEQIRASYDQGVLDVFHALMGMAKGK